MKFTEEEKELIKNCMDKYEQEFEEKLNTTKEGIVTAVNLGHDLFEIVSTPFLHKLKDSILRKCDIEVETIEEKVEREEVEAVESEKERKKRLKAKLEAESKLELERQMKELGLVEEEPKEEEPREDVSRVEMFNNFDEVREKKEAKEKEKELIAQIPPIDMENLDNNTVVELKVFANFLEIEHDPRVLKADLINSIKEKLGEE